MYYIDYISPTNLLLVGAICTGTGLFLFRKAYTGDTLFPGTLWTHIPTWIFWATGGLLQIPLPLAYFFLKLQKVI